MPREVPSHSAPRVNDQKRQLWTAVKWVLGGATMAIVGYESLRAYKRIRNGPGGEEEHVPEPNPAGFSSAPPPMPPMPALPQMPSFVPMPWPTTPYAAPAPPPGPASNPERPRVVVINASGRSKKGNGSDDDGRLTQQRVDELLAELDEAAL